MVCKYCKLRPVIRLTNNNIKLCKSCFIKYFESKVKNTISKFKLVDKEDHLCVAVSGGKDSLTVLYLINKIFSKRKDIKITALAIDEGIKGYRETSLKFLKKFCKELKVKLKIYSFKKEFGKSLDLIVKKYAYPCSVCGVLRRFLLNSKARKLKCSKLVTGHNLDDEAQTVLMNQFRSNVEASARGGPKTGVSSHEKFITRIKPLYMLTEKEIKTYAFLKGFVDKFTECPYAGVSYRGSVRDFINEFELKYPGTKNNIINSYLSRLPLFKKKFQKSKIKLCSCGEPCSGIKCRTCDLVKELGLKG